MSDRRIEVIVADITTLDVDAIVNAANEQLRPGGGVCGAIHRAAGPELAAACAALGGCPTGEARITPGFNLRAQHVIHAVGPVWQGGGHDEAALLAGAYRSALERAAQHQLESIAFPAISTGVYGYPLQEATALAVQIVRAWTSGRPKPERIVFCAFDNAVAEAYRSALK